MRPFLALALALMTLVEPARAGMHLAVASETDFAGIPSFHVSGYLAPAMNPVMGVTLDAPGVAVAVSASGAARAVLAADGTLHFFGSSSYDSTWSVDVGSADRGCHLTFAAGDLVLLLSRGPEVIAYSTQAGAEIHRRTFPGPVTGMATHRGPRPAASGTHGGGAETLHDPAVLHAAGRLWIYDVLRDAIDDAIVVPQGEGLAIDAGNVAWFVTASPNSRLVSVALGTGVVQVLTLGAPVEAPVAPSPEGTRVAVASAGRREVLVWSVAEQVIVRTFTLDARVTAMAMADAASIVVGVEDVDVIGRGLLVIDVMSGRVRMEGEGSVAAIAGAWGGENQEDLIEMLDVAIGTRASQGSVDGVQAALNARLDVAVSTRASQASVDALGSAIASRASQASVDALGSSMDTRASQSSVDALGSSIDTRASQASVDALGSSMDTRASQSSVDALGSSIDTRASQASVDALGSSMDTRASQSSVDALGSTLDSILGGVNGTNARLDASLDVAVGTRASQASLDALAADEQARADAVADEHALILSRLDGGNRQLIEAALVAGAMQPLFMIPAGADMDPAGLGLTCPGLPPAGMTGVDGDGLLEVVRCVTRRSIDDMRAIGEDVTRAEREFQDAESDRMASPPRLRDAAEGYAAALQVAMRGR